MNDSLLSKTLARKKLLIKTYRETAQFGLVLGAGVTVASKVPDYNNLALRLLESATQHPKFTGAKDWAQSLVEHQRKQRKEGRVTIPPDELILYVRTQLENDENKLQELVQQELYKDVKVGKTAGRGVFESNSTLNAILTFCAARPGTILSPKDSKYQIEVNNKVGGILTTNYDNLVESAFHTKYRFKLLKPVGRPSTNEFEQRERRPTIPVYHIHGYVGFQADKNGKGQDKNPDIVIAEDDYFETFYNPLGFGNYIAMSFLRRYPTLFIGAGMTDKNLRRFLYHLYDATDTIPMHQRKYAILQLGNSPVDTFMDVVLMGYGVKTIWIKEFTDVQNILQEMYIASGKGNTEKTLSEDWKYLNNYRWGKKQNQ
jgi:hypothetical protein